MKQGVSVLYSWWAKTSLSFIVFNYLSHVVGSALHRPEQGGLHSAGHREQTSVHCIYNNLWVCRCVCVHAYRVSEQLSYRVRRASASVASSSCKVLLNLILSQTHAAALQTLPETAAQTPVYFHFHFQARVKNNWFLVWDLLLLLFFLSCSAALEGELWSECFVSLFILYVNK